MNLGDRMKRYESASAHVLTRRTPTIIRVDGVAFHTFTKGMQKPFDTVFRKAMQETAKYLQQNIQGCEIAYVQSDEISLYLQDNKNLETDAWHGKKLQKLASVAASMATMQFNKEFRKQVRKYRNHNENDYVDVYVSKVNNAYFDGRAFILPDINEVYNYFLWRQRDCIRNSVLSVSQFYFSHKSMQGIKVPKLIEKLYEEKKINYNEKYSDCEKYGTFYIDGHKQSYKMDKNSEIIYDHVNAFLTEPELYTGEEIDF